METGINVLIVEDEAMIAELLQKMVLQLGAQKVWVCADGACALETAKRHPVDLVYMDLNLQGAMDGIQCARHITQYKDVSIVFATSFCDAETLEEAIDLNTLNYLVKPYGKKDVEITMTLARIARKRRQNNLSNTSELLRSLEGGLTLDTRARTLRGTDGAIRLSKKEFDLLALLSEYANQTVATEKILSQVWHHRTIAASTLRETITRLRKKVPSLRITAVHGSGYRLDQERLMS
jgi:DNA-binding response OmpR family regulator